MRFGKKSFIISVVAFVLCLNFGFLTLCVYSYQSAINTQRELCKIQYEAIASDLQENYDKLVKYRNEEKVYVLFESFAKRYNSDDVYLDFFDPAGKPFLFSVEFFDKPIEFADQNTIEEIDDVDKNRYVMINSSVCDGKYYMVYAVCINKIISDQTQITFNFAMASVVISVLVTLILYFAMRKTSKVLEQAINTSDAVTSSQAQSGVVDQFRVKGLGWAKVEKSFNDMLVTVNEKVERANKNAEQKQMLVNHVANQLNMPLTSISRTATDILNSGVEDKAIEDKVRYMFNEAQRLQQTSQKLLDIAYIKEKKIDLADVNVGAILSDVAYGFSKYALSIGVNIETEIKDMTVKADATLLSVLFYNVTDNAVKACNSGCTVTLSCFDNTVVIADNGIGLTKDQLERLTEPFYKVENSKTTTGSGLGLALCKEIIDVHGASIRFESEPGYGTKVFIDFAAPGN